MKYFVIAALDKNYGIGKDNDLLFHLKKDLAYFKKLTLNHKVVMGYNTYKSLRKPLKDRENIVISREPIDGFKTFKNKEELLKYYQDEEGVIFIIGGAKIYRDFIDIADRIYLTEIEGVKDADTFFPKFNKDNYIKEIVGKDYENDISFHYVLYKKKER